MWIATNRGFLSVVTADKARLPKAEKKLAKTDTVLCVRARSVDHLKELFPGTKVYQFPGRDYPARIFIQRDELADLMAAEVRGIDYPNFKSSVKDNALHDAYMAVWSVMHRYQMGGFAPRPYSPVRQGGFDWEGAGYNRRTDWGAPFNEQVPDDDEACSTPGCTDMDPCLNCLCDTLADDFDKADQKHEAQVADDRYGDFDSGDEDDDDSGAESHRRAAP